MVGIASFGDLIDISFRWRRIYMAAEMQAPPFSTPMKVHNWFADHVNFFFFFVYSELTRVELNDLMARAGQKLNLAGREVDRVKSPGLKLYGAFDIEGHLGTVRRQISPEAFLSASSSSDPLGWKVLRTRFRTRFSARVPNGKVRRTQLPNLQSNVLQLSPTNTCKEVSFEHVHTRWLIT